MGIILLLQSRSCWLTSLNFNGLIHISNQIFPLGHHRVNVLDDKFDVLRQCSQNKLVGWAYSIFVSIPGACRQKCYKDIPDYNCVTSYLYYYTIYFDIQMLTLSSV